MINVNPVPQQELERVKESLSTTIDTLVGVIAAGGKAEVSGGTPSTLGGKAARAYVLRTKNETSYVRGCLFNGRIYIATTGGVGVTETHENATAFFDNFIPK